MLERAEILQKLVLFDEPVDPLVSALRQYPWDWIEEEPLVRITALQILNVIDRFLSVKISAQQLEDWAENLECREDVGFDEKHEVVLGDVLFRMANPLLNEPLNGPVVAEMRTRIQAALN